MHSCHTARRIARLQLRRRPCQYEEAMKDLSKGQSIDYDDSAQEWLKEVLPIVSRRRPSCSVV